MTMEYLKRGTSAASRREEDAKVRTTVEAILRLNPGIDPEALRVGQRIRVTP